MRRAPVAEAVPGRRTIPIMPWRRRQQKAARNDASNWEEEESKQQPQQRVAAREQRAHRHDGIDETQVEMPPDGYKRENRFEAGVVKCMKVVVIAPFVALWGVVFVTGTVVYGTGVVFKEIGSYATACVWEEEDFDPNAKSKKSPRKFDSDRRAYI